MKFNKEVTDYIQEATEDQRVLLEEIRQLIHESNPGTTEAIKWGMPVFAKNKDYTYLRYAKKHLTLGFYNFERIEDPDKLLEGNGKTMRHIKIKKKEDIKADLIGKWLKSIAD